MPEGYDSSEITTISPMISTSNAARTDPVVDYYKQFVDRSALREILRLSADERCRRMEAIAQATSIPQAQPPSPDRAWQPVSDCGPGRSSDPVIELYKRDIDRTLLRENLRRTADQRCQALESLARLVDEFRSQKRRTEPNRDRLQWTAATAD
jgi:hypothetical protein